MTNIVLEQLEILDHLPDNTKQKPNGPLFSYFDMATIIGPAHYRIGG